MEKKETMAPTRESKALEIFEGLCQEYPTWWKILTHGTARAEANEHHDRVTKMGKNLIRIGFKAEVREIMDKHKTQIETRPQYK